MRDDDIGHRHDDDGDGRCVVLRVRVVEALPDDAESWKPSEPLVGLTVRGRPTAERN
jgi:hypothetical protein